MTTDSQTPGKVVELALEGRFPHSPLIVSAADLVAEVAIDALRAAGYAVVTKSLLHSLHDPEPCSFDHHGGCQAHGYLSLNPGDVCPQRAVGDLLTANEGRGKS